MFQNTKRLLDYAESIGIPAAEVKIYHKGSEVFSERRGYFDDEKKIPLGEGALYNIYSCSKFITCTAALMLLEKGKFSLDDDVAEYLPAFGDMKVKKNGGIFKAERRMKVHQLFTMTSGMNYDCASEEVKRGILETEGKAPTVEMMKYLAKIPLEFEPGENWRYSLSHDVIGALVEVVSGVRFGEFVKANIFDPLGMKDSTYLLPESEHSRVCAHYRYNSAEKKYEYVGKRVQTFLFGEEYESGGAGIVSTVDDYMRFLEAMRCHKLISEEMTALMSKNHLTEKQGEACWASEGYGYGLGVRAPKTGSKRTDYGWGGAAGAFAAVDPVNDITLYYSQHVLTSPFAPLRKDYIEAAKLDLGFEAFEEDMFNFKGKTLA